MNVSGGSIDFFFRAIGSDVSISGGLVQSFEAMGGSGVNITNGSVHSFGVNGSEANISAAHSAALVP